MPNENMNTQQNDLSNSNDIDLSKIPPLVLQRIARSAGPQTSGRFAQACKHTRDSLATLNEEKVYIALLQAVLDGNTEMAERILDGRPAFLLKKPDTIHPDKKIILTTKSWRKILIDVSPFELVFNLGQLPQPEMIELMLPYIKKLESTGIITNAKEIALDQWKAPVKNIQREKGYKEFQTLLQKLENAISNETFPKGQFSQLSTRTEYLLTQFREMTLPDRVMRLDEYFVGEEELLDAFRVYNRIYSQRNQYQCTTFCIKVIGWMQSLMMSPYTAMVFCAGLADVAEHKKEITKNAQKLILYKQNNTPFYRSSFESLSGLGGTYFINENGWACWGTILKEELYVNFQNLVRANTVECESLKRKLQSGHCGEPKPKQPPLLKVPAHIIRRIGYFAGPQTTANLAKTCTQTRKALPLLNEEEEAYIALLQAVLDGNTKMAKRILDERPRLLLKKPDTTHPNKKIILTTKSWREILIDVSPFELVFTAWQLPQPEMIELMLSYIEKLDTTMTNILFVGSTGIITNAKKIALGQWKAPVKNIQREKGYKEFQTLLQKLENAISIERFWNCGRISTETEDLLMQFRDMTLPDRVMRLDEYFVGEQELQDAYDIYVKNFDEWEGKQKSAFCIRVIGWLQSFVSPRTAMVFCTDLEDVVQNEKKITPLAQSFILKDGKTPFYRSSRSSLSGLGGYFIGDRGGWRSWVGVGLGYAIFRKLCQANTVKCELLKRKLQSEHCDEPKPKQPSLSLSQ